MRSFTGKGLVAAATAGTDAAAAHGFGERYELPLPLELFLSASGAVVLASFAAMAIFLRRGRELRAYPRLPLPHLPWVAALLRGLGVAAYLLVIAAGLFGTQSTFKNIAPILTWIAGWVGFAYVAALLGNLWALVNPLDTLFRLGERLWPRALAIRLAYPHGLGQWPAVFLFLVFAWAELIAEGADAPGAVALGILAYSLITWVGMALFGRQQWLASGELFTIVYGYLARFAPLEWRDGGLCLRPYAVGLLPAGPLAPSETTMVVFILAGVSFDGFLETPAWAAIAATLGSSPWVKASGLLVAMLAFVAAYLATCSAIARGSGRPGGALLQTAGLFALTLVPIAIAYHVAHYLSFFLMGMQYLVPLASDPFGVGWDLFGVAHHFVRPVILDARAVWYISVGAIVGGHVVAVVLAHAVALREFGSRRAALRSQYPMVLLMVAYTMMSLWIIAQPIVALPR